VGNLAHRYGLGQGPQDPKLKAVEVGSFAARAAAALSPTGGGEIAALRKELAAERASRLELAARVERLEAAIALPKTVTPVTAPLPVTLPVTGKMTSAEKQRAYRERQKATRSGVA
jgi:hypothetical protein